MTSAPERMRAGGELAISAAQYTDTAQQAKVAVAAATLGATKDFYTDEALAAKLPFLKHRHTHLAGRAKYAVVQRTYLTQYAVVSIERHDRQTLRSYRLPRLRRDLKLRL